MDPMSPRRNAVSEGWGEEVSPEGLLRSPIPKGSTTLGVAGRLLLLKPPGCGRVASSSSCWLLLVPAAWAMLMHARLHPSQTSAPASPTSSAARTTAACRAAGSATTTTTAGTIRTKRAAVRAALPPSLTHELRAGGHQGSPTVPQLLMAQLFTGRGAWGRLGLVFGSSALPLGKSSAGVADRPTNSRSSGERPEVVTDGRNGPKPGASWAAVPSQHLQG